MTRTLLRRAFVVAVLVSLAVPGLASADLINPDGSASPFPQSAQLNTLWLVIAGCLVMFMQAGFAFLEIGFSRAKNAGTVVAKILTNFSIAALGYWAVGFGLAFGLGNEVAGLNLWGTKGFFLNGIGDSAANFPVMGLSNATIESKWFFQFVFCAVSLAIVWGTTLERIKFGVYIIYAIVFSTIIYPIASHWVFGGGFLQMGELFGDPSWGMQDFAGSTAVHLIGATGAFAALLLLGARKGKYDRDGKPRAIPGHSMPLFGLGVLILWLGWFGFNPGSALGTGDGRFAEVLIVTQLAAAAGVLGAALTSKVRQKAFDIGMTGNGAIAALVAITAPSGYVELWTAPIIGFIAGVIVVLSIIAIDKYLDDPVGALSAHGIAGIWGTVACGIFTSPRLATYNAFGDPEGGLVYKLGNGVDLADFKQLAAQIVGFSIAFAFVFAMSYGTFWAIKKTYGLRVSEDEEDAGLDISEHGMYGYPEQFIPAPELVGYGATPASAPVRASAAQPIPTSTEVPAT